MDAPREMSGVLTVVELMANLEAPPEARQRRIAGENAVAPYGLPVTVPG